MTELKPDLLPATEELISYIGQYGGRCRHCADEDGVCPGSGLPCDQSRNTKAIKHVLHAINYGVAHGYLPDPRASKARANTEVEFRVGDRVGVRLDRYESDPDWLNDWREPGDRRWFGYIVGIERVRDRRTGQWAIEAIVTDEDDIDCNYRSEGFLFSYLEPAPVATRIRSAIAGGE